MKHLTVEQAHEEIESSSEPLTSFDLPTLWFRVRPFVVMLGALLGKKVNTYITAFVAAIDSLTSQDAKA